MAMVSCSMCSKTFSEKMNETESFGRDVILSKVSNPCSSSLCLCKESGSMHLTS